MHCIPAEGRKAGIKKMHAIQVRSIFSFHTFVRVDAHPNERVKCVGKCNLNLRVMKRTVIGISLLNKV